jgi:hypothetical protein
MKITATQQGANAIGEVLNIALKAAGMQALDIVNIMRASIELESKPKEPADG